MVFGATWPARLLMTLSEHCAAGGHAPARRALQPVVAIEVFLVNNPFHTHPHTGTRGNHTPQAETGEGPRDGRDGSICI